VFITYLASKFGTRKALKESRPEADPEEVTLKLRGLVGVLFWLAVGIGGSLYLKSPLFPVIIATLGLRRMAIVRREEREEVASEPTYMYAPAQWTPPKAPSVTPKAPKVADALPFPEEVLERVQLSVWQSSTGPVVSVITVPDGEILTKTFPSWPSAGRYVDKVKKGYEAKGVRVTFVEEQI